MMAASILSSVSAAPLHLRQTCAVRCQGAAAQGLPSRCAYGDAGSGEAIREQRGYWVAQHVRGPRHSRHTAKGLQNGFQFV
jgi:hypothetical protein